MKSVDYISKDEALRELGHKVNDAQEAADGEPGADGPEREPDREQDQRCQRELERMDVRGRRERAVQD
ncbi:MAG: hypothetical protein QOD71_3332, partial [Thermoleophilaceae bacterium]|nr:hypothetical protein [Thermoleophilaceae bacterium]